MCEFEKNLIAWIDGELETDAALEVERHLNLCKSCSAKVSQYREVSGAFAAYHAAVPVEKNQSGFRRRAGAAALVVAAAIILWMLWPPIQEFQLQPPKTAEPPVMAFEIPPPSSVAPLSAGLPAPVNSAPHQPAVKAVASRQADSQSRAARQNRAWQNQAVRQNQAVSQGLEPFVEIAIPADALFAPGAVPPGFAFTADLSIGGDGAPRVLRVQPGVFLK
jgi:anti-sigma factor RsiW